MVVFQGGEGLSKGRGPARRSWAAGGAQICSDRKGVAEVMTGESKHYMYDLIYPLVN